VIERAPDSRPAVGTIAVDDIRRVAYEIVLRACGFGSLTIFCIMIGLSFNPLVSFQSGGFLTTVMTLILALKAFEARRKPYRRTEMCQAPRGLGAADHVDHHARGLPDFCGVDLDHCHRHVGSGAIPFLHRPVRLAAPR
jgi:hypothetical protein